MNNVEEIIKFVDKNSYFDLDFEEDDSILFRTRENGDVGSETASDDDYIEAVQLVELLKSKFNVDCKIEVVDEWVDIEVTNKKKEIEEYKYAFKKDFEGRGFTRGFDSMDLLIKEFGSWIDVDWDSITKEVEAVKEFPNNNFAGSHTSNDILIKKRGEEGNTWGYDFFIVKLMRKVLVDSE